MTNREVRQHPKFSSELKKLSRRHHGLKDAIDNKIAELASGKEEDLGDKIPGLKGRPVFKKRMKYGNLSKRNGPRMIYYYDDKFLIALFIYLKSDRADIPKKEIEKALARYGL